MRTTLGTWAEDHPGEMGTMGLEVWVLPQEMGTMGMKDEFPPWGDGHYGDGELGPTTGRWGWGCAPPMGMGD